MAGQKHVGKPAWYRSVLVEIDDVGLDADDHYWPDVSDGMQVTPYLYKLEWVDKDAEPDEVNGEHPAYTLYRHEEHKWGYLVPIYEQAATQTEVVHARVTAAENDGDGSDGAAARGNP